MLRRPIIVIGVILTIVIMTMLIFRIIGGLRGGEERLPERPKPLSEYAWTDAKVRMTTVGTINSNEMHRVLQITVGRDNVEAVVMAGYQGRVIKSERFGNNPEAYKSFLSALDTVNFTHTQQPAPGANELGSCPQGQRYVFEIYDPEKTILYSWSTSCSKRLGSFGGNITQTRVLFQAQVPDYNDFVWGVRL